jgi:hypothetical protein
MHIKFLFRISFALIGRFPVYIYPAFGTIFRFTDGLRNNFLETQAAIGKPEQERVTEWNFSISKWFQEAIRNFNFGSSQKDNLKS